MHRGYKYIYNIIIIIIIQGKARYEIVHSSWFSWAVLMRSIISYITMTELARACFGIYICLLLLLFTVALALASTRIKLMIRMCVLCVCFYALATIYNMCIYVLYLYSYRFEETRTQTTSAETSITQKCYSFFFSLLHFFPSRLLCSLSLALSFGCLYRRRQ